METQTIEVAAPEVTAEVISPEVITTTTEAIPEVTTEETIPEMTDAELDAFVASILAEEAITPPVTEPQFFTKEKEEKVISELVIINELIGKQAEAEVAHETKVAETIKQLEEIQAIADEKQAEIDVVNGLYTNIETILTPEIAKALAVNDTENIPAYLIKEKRELVENHPFVWPLYRSLLDWQEVSIPKLLKDAISKMKTIPNVATIANPEKVEPIKTISDMDSVVNWMITRHSQFK